MAGKPTGYVRIIERKGGSVAYAKLKLPDGTQPCPKLGKLWTKRTRPPEGYLTRGMAGARLEAILAGGDPLVNIAPSHVTFGKACDEHLRYLEHDRQRKPSYLKDCRSIVNGPCCPSSVSRRQSRTSPRPTSTASASGCCRRGSRTRPCTRS